MFWLLLLMQLCGPSTSFGWGLLTTVYSMSLLEAHNEVAAVAVAVAVAVTVDWNSCEPTLASHLGCPRTGWLFWVILCPIRLALIVQRDIASIGFDFFLSLRFRNKKVLSCWKYLTFFCTGHGQSGGTSGWRVCYQRGLHRLVYLLAIISFLTMECWNQTLQYFFGARVILHSKLPREYTD